MEFLYKFNYNLVSDYGISLVLLSFEHFSDTSASILYSCRSGTMMTGPNFSLRMEQILWIRVRESYPGARNGYYREPGNYHRIVRIQIDLLTF